MRGLEKAVCSKSGGWWLHTEDLKEAISPPVVERRWHIPHEAIRANRFISQLLDHADKRAKSVCHQPAQRAVT